MNFIDHWIERWIASIDRQKYKNLLFFFFFGLFGITVEVFFTAFQDPYIKYPSVDTNLTLRGFTYPWMLPIHGLIAVTFPLIYRFIGKWFVLFRMTIYMIGIFAIEFVSGFILKQITGSCPWHYVDWPEFYHFIRLDYTPWWMLYGLFAETVLKILNHFFGTTMK